MDRLTAVHTAREFVLDLYPAKNDSQYPTSTSQVREVISQIMAVAEYLEGAPLAQDPNVLEQIRDSVRSIDQAMP